LDPILAAAVAFAISQIALSALLLCRSPTPMSLSEWLFLAFLITVAAYLLDPLTHNHWLAPYQHVIENFLPGIFWLFCSSIFNDKFKIKSWHLSLIGLTVVLPLINQTLSSQSIELPATIFVHSPQILEFILLTLALLEVLRHWNDDLIESRRGLRLWFCSMTGLYIFTIIALREIIIPQSDWLAFWQYFPVGIMCLLTNLLLIQYRPDLLKVINKVNQAKADVGKTIKNTKRTSIENDVDTPPKVVAQLNELMTKQFIYRKMSLTIGQLAQELNLPEYRLRRIINSGLGFRNFNDYLNGFRIKEAGERLSDPSQNRETVLNIALETGFKSLSSFNKAFRESFGVTPTVYRQQQNQDN